MWGDPERAAHLEPSDPLWGLLLQVTGPAHIPWNDPRWQELLHGYNVWVHCEATSLHSHCESMARHAATSSNLAALCLHVSRMLRDLVTSTAFYSSKKNDFSETISLVGKARATAGALVLSRILIHHVLATTEITEDTFLYRNRDITERNRADCMAGHDLCHACLAFLACQKCTADYTPWTSVPELYDTTNACLELTVVLFSTQLYGSSDNYFMNYIFKEAQRRHQSVQEISTYDSALGEPTCSTDEKEDWTPQSLLEATLSWQLHRPAAPERSIAHHFCQLTQSVVSAKEKRVGPDGMYESHLVVMASRPKTSVQSAGGSASSTELTTTTTSYGRPPSRLILDATKGVLVFSSTLILLPFRLMSLAFGLWGHSGDNYDDLRKQHLQIPSKKTHDVLWLSDSPVADGASCLLLLLLHNFRSQENPFRKELAALTDNRWQADDEGDLLAENGGATTEFESFVNAAAENKPLLNGTPSPKQHHLTLNFETLFESFGDTLHTEVGALMLYTTLQTSPAFASFLVVRSDLDTLVMPLLRTLYFSSAMRHYSPAASRNGNSLSIKSSPFRSSSQLYVILILLLLFSQDASFGPDAFRRVQIAQVVWYKERNLRGINLGSMLVLVILRAITFNMNKLQDAFLLSNCCAVLMNLSHNIVNLHEYAAMRLASVTVAALKRFAYLSNKRDGAGNADDISTPLGMYAEVSHTLLRLLRHCVCAKNIDRNLQLVYALVYHQADFHDVVSKKSCPVKKAELARIQSVMTTASTLIQEDGNARTATKAMGVLEKHVERLKEAATAASGSSQASDAGDFTFTYQEEADPEVFFIPYVWEVIVCVATASRLDWNKSQIKVFPLLEDDEEEEEPEPPTTGYVETVDDAV